MQTPTARRRERPGLRAVAAALVSAALNAGGVGALAAAGAFRIGPPGAAPVALAPLSPEAWEAHRRVEPPAAPLPAAAPPPPAAPRAPAPEPRGRLVRVAPASDPRRPERARFLAERDGSVERETRWRGPPPPQPVAALAPRPTPGSPGASGTEERGDEGTADETAPGRRGAPASAAARLEDARRVLAPAGDLRVRPAVAVALAGEGEGGLARRGRYDPRLLPLAEGAAATGGGAPSGEALPGVADGDATLVNTRAFRFAAFYRRVHDAIAGEWRPNQAWDEVDPQDRRLGRTTRQVQLDILLDRDGRLREVRLVEGSGLAFFDAECVRAVQAAAPFPNPPRALVASDGTVALRGWRLVFEFGTEAILDRWLPRR